MPAQWGATTAREIVFSINGELISGPDDRVFTALCTDSRESAPGQLFWALKGERYDGHDFVTKAVEGGAAGIVVQTGWRVNIPAYREVVVMTVPDTLKALGDLAAWWRHQHAVRVAAVTGSAGKTTTKEMTASILSLNTMTLKNKGNFNNLVGLPLTLLQLEEFHRIAVLEMGMNRRGEIARLTEIADPDIGLITNVARAHLEGLGDIRGVARAKVELLEKMSSEGRAILNGDDELLLKVASPFRREIMTYGTGPANDVRARNVRNLGRKGISFELHHQGNVIEIGLRVAGLQSVFNALAASAIALAIGESYDHIAEGLNRFEGIKGRFMLTALPGGMTLVDDTYNSNPSSLKAAMDSLRDLGLDGGQVVVGLGEMMELGDETEPAHLEAGGMVADLGPDYFVAMGEHAGEMIRGAMVKGFPPERAAVAKSHREMARIIRDVMKKGDLLLLKGSRKACLEKVTEILKEGASKEV